MPCPYRTRSIPTKLKSAMRDPPDLRCACSISAAPTKAPKARGGERTFSAGAKQLRGPVESRNLGRIETALPSIEVSYQFNSFPVRAQH